MSRVSLFSSPFMLGFDAFEERLDRLAKSAESYPPYNIERIRSEDGSEHFEIAIAVAGFAPDELEIFVEDNQLQVRGRTGDKGERDYLHRGIATRQFQRSFLLADGVIVNDAHLENGLLKIGVSRPATPKVARRIDINVKE